MFTDDDEKGAVSIRILYAIAAILEVRSQTDGFTAPAGQNKSLLLRQ
ncbi:hypothetical protein [Gloeothece citriformis]|nr:hypothetical protein [Gloeothece citriformis]